MADSHYQKAHRRQNRKQPRRDRK